MCRWSAIVTVYAIWQTVEWCWNTWLLEGTYQVHIQKGYNNNFMNTIFYYALITSSAFLKHPFKNFFSITSTFSKRHVTLNLSSHSHVRTSLDSHAFHMLQTTYLHWFHHLNARNENHGVILYVIFCNIIWRLPFYVKMYPIPSARSIFFNP
jgi:ribonuclease HIII